MNVILHEKKLQIRKLQLTILKRQVSFKRGCVCWGRDRDLQFPQCTRNIIFKTFFELAFGSEPPHTKLSRNFISVMSMVHVSSTSSCPGCFWTVSNFSLSSSCLPLRHAQPTRSQSAPGQIPSHPMCCPPPLLMSGCCLQLPHWTPRRSLQWEDYNYKVWKGSFCLSAFQLPGTKQC